MPNKSFFTLIMKKNKKKKDELTAITTYHPPIAPNPNHTQSHPNPPLPPLLPPTTKTPKISGITHSNLSFKDWIVRQKVFENFITHSNL